MADKPGKGKPGASTTTFGGKASLIKKRRTLQGGYLTVEEASRYTFSTQQEKSFRRNLYLKALKKRRQLLDAQRAKNYGRKAGFLSPGCHPEGVRDSKIYKYSKENLPTTVPQSRFLCKIPPYREKKWTSQLNELRVFVEGAEISTYIRGGVSWSYQSTSGMNSFRCTLNNDSDAFIITPQNVCANLNLSGWRVGQTQKGTLVDSQGREGARFDEVPKYKIYARKYRAVNPEDKKTANIDDTGMWLYPLNPYSVIFDKHDAMRAFTRMPHVTGVGRRIQGKREGWQLWMPIFTGFLRSISWHDDPVGGDRSVSLDAYDYKGLMNRMRVRTVGFRMPGSGGALGSRERANDQAIYGTKKNKHTRQFDKLGAQIWGNIMQELGLHKPLNDLFKAVWTLELIKCRPQPPTQECIATAQATAKKATDSYTPEAKTAYDKGGKALVTIKKYTSINYTIGPKTQKAGDKITFHKVSVNTKKKGKGGSNKDGGAVTKGLSDLISAVKTDEIPVSVTGTTTTTFLGLDQDLWDGTAGKETLFTTGEVYLGEALGGIAGNIPRSRKVALAGYSKLLKEALTTIFRGDDTGGKEFLGRLNKILSDAGNGRLTTSDDKPNTVSLTVIANKTWSQLSQWRDDVVSAIHQVGNDLKKEVAQAKKTAKLQAKILDSLRNKLLQQIKSVVDQQAAAKRSAKAGAERRAQNIVNQTKKARAEGAAKQPRVKVPDNVAALYLRNPTFEGLNVGIYNDLNETVARGTGGTPHPLANMSYEQASEFLICKNTNMKAGVRLDVGRYKEGVMESYNRQAVFGILGRPYTYQEVTTIGKLTTSDYNKDVFAPVNGFYNLVTPASGTGAATIVQADVSANQQNTKTIQYATRLSLMQQISDLIDFQWYINPMGDNCVEMPNYNILPIDFGKTFAGAYRVQLEWQGGDINEEATDIPTGWVFQGNESEALGQGIFDRNKIANELFKKVPILAPILVRRLGVQVEHVSIDLPGVGGTIGALTPLVAQDAIRIWGLVYIQRQLGAAHTVTASMPFRPYLLPNRPVHIVPRQRIGLINTVDFNCEPPSGSFSVSFSTKYVRLLFRDGTFRTVAGGYRQPVDYTGFFSGVQTFRVREGVQANQSHKNPRNYSANIGVPTTNPSSGSYVKMPRNYGAFGCDPSLKGAFLDAATSYGDDLGSAGKTPVGYGSSVSGSGGAAGSGQYAEGGDNQIIGARIHRTVSNKNKDEGGDAITTEGTGLLEKRRNKKPHKTGPRYDLSKMFHNPYPFGNEADDGRWKQANGKHVKFMQWISRYFSSKYLTGYQSGAKGAAWHRGAKLRRHAGIDILVDEGTEIIAPVNFNWITATLVVGPWGEGGQGNPVKWINVANFDEVKRIRDLAVIRNNFPIWEYTNSGMRVKVYARQYDAWIKSGRKLKVKRGGGKKGLAITGTGRVLPPNITSNPALSRTVKAASRPEGIMSTISFIHCSEFQKGPKGGFIRTARKGDVIGKVGSTGTKWPHIHVDMWIHKPSGKVAEREPGRVYPKNYIGQDPQQALFDAALKANREYLETLLLLKITGGKPDSGKISPEWQKYFKGRGIKISTVKEAVQILYASSKLYQILSEGTRSKLLTNAFLYFKPNDLLKGVTDFRNFKETWYSTAPIAGGGGDPSQKSSICGKLPTAEVKKLQIELKLCLLKVGKVTNYNPSYRPTAKKRRDRCRRKFNQNMVAYQKTVKQIDSRNVEKKLVAQTDRQMGSRKKKDIPQASQRQGVS